MPVTAEIAMVIRSVLRVRWIQVPSVPGCSSVFKGMVSPMGINQSIDIDDRRLEEVL